jgi:SHS2 domain-containing protein
MLKGMISGLRPEILNSETEARNIEIKSPDIESLLVDFLSEILYLTQVNKEIYIDIKFKKLIGPSMNSGQAELEGELVGQKVKRFGEDIKAVTYHDLEIQKKGGDWQAIVLFDI